MSNGKYLAIERIRHGERRRDPAVSVDGLGGQRRWYNAGYGITHELGGGDDHRAGQQQHSRE